MRPEPSDHPAELAYWFGLEAANAAELVNWNAGEEFRAARDRSQGK